MNTTPKHKISADRAEYNELIAEIEARIQKDREELRTSTQELIDFQNKWGLHA